MTNFTLDNIKKRYSCRAFTDEMPTDEHLMAAARAAIQSPSAVNRQAWRIVIVKNRALIDEMEAEGMKALAAMPDRSGYDRIMGRGGKLFYNSPCMIMVPAQPNTDIDNGIVCQTISLAAESMGMGSLICGLAGLAFSGDKAEYFKQKLGFPEGYEFGIAVLLGFSAKETAPHEPDEGKISVVE